MSRGIEPEFWCPNKAHAESPILNLRLGHYQENWGSRSVTALRDLCVLGVSAVDIEEIALTAETPRTQRPRRELKLLAFRLWVSVAS
jgi:hypothetical protein